MQSTTRRRGRWHGRIEILISDFEKTTIEDEMDLR
jgi:hypothetical protein